MLAVHVDELPRVLRLLRLPGPTQLVVLDPLRDATVRPIIVSFESCSTLVGLGHFLEKPLPACMGMREAASCLTIPFHVLALLAVGVVMAVLLEVGHVDPELAYDGRLDLVGCPAVRWSLIEARGSLLLSSGSSASRRAADPGEGLSRPSLALWPSYDGSGVDDPVVGVDNERIRTPVVSEDDALGSEGSHVAGRLTSRSFARVPVEDALAEPE